MGSILHARMLTDRTLVIIVTIEPRSFGTFEAIAASLTARLVADHHSVSIGKVNLKVLLLLYGV